MAEAKVEPIEVLRDSDRQSTGRLSRRGGQVSHRQPDAKPTDVKAGDPINLLLGIAGTGPMDLVQAPPLAELPALTRDFKVPNEPLAGYVEGDRKVFSTTIRPRKDGITEIPPIPFTYFDPESRQVRDGCKARRSRSKSRRPTRSRSTRWSAAAHLPRTIRTVRLFRKQAQRRLAWRISRATICCRTNCRQRRSGDRWCCCSRCRRWWCSEFLSCGLAAALQQLQADSVPASECAEPGSRSRSNRPRWRHAVQTLLAKRFGLSGSKVDAVAVVGAHAFGRLSQFGGSL